MRADVVPIVCPGCGEERLVEVDAAGRVWYCQVCGQSGVVPAAPTGAPSASRESLHALLLVLVQRHLAPGTWQVVTVAPIAQYPRSLQHELTRTLNASPESVVLVLERVP
jgi:ribosomal protein S27E